MIYFIQTTIYTALLHLVYLLFMKNRSSHAWSRAYLLINMVLPFALPFVKINGLQSSGSAVTNIMLPVLTVGSNISAKAGSIGILPIAYGAVCFTLLGYLLAQVIQLILFVRRHEAELRGNIQLVRGTGMGPGSWFSYVFIPGNEANNAILEHEAAHVYYRHSYDIVLSRLLLCFAWPNLMLWLILKELKTVHEFQADAVAVNDRQDYSKSLLNELFHTRHFALSHTFFHHPIKRRITMLQKTHSHAGKLKVIILSLLLVTGMLYVQCAKDSEQGKKAASKGEIVQVVGPEGPMEVEMVGPETVADFDKAPEFNGDLMKFMAKNIVYPKAARDKKIEGKVIVKLGIDQKGELTTIDVIKSPDESLTKAALDVINKMPKWKPAMKDGKPVKAQLTLPISYKL